MLVYNSKRKQYYDGRQLKISHICKASVSQLRRSKKPFGKRRFDAVLIRVSSAMASA